MSDEKISFACPSCRGCLERSNNCLSCETCGVKWNIENDIYSFSKKKVFWSHITQTEIDELIRISEVDGWKEGLERILLKSRGTYTYEYALFEDRADFNFLLPIKPNSTILDVGCGWGAISVALARYYETVVAADPVIDTLKFLKVRKKQEELQNIKLVHIEPLEYGKLPFPDSSFDLVILNGVLEWIGTARLDISPSKCQKIALAEVRRVLKPEGVVYIGIENRFSPSNLVGGTGHSGVPFAEVLPRRIGNLLCKAMGRGSLRNYVYSYWEYKKLLSSCGFSNISFWFTIPSYRTPLIMIHERDRNVQKFYYNNLIMSRLRRIFVTAMHVVRVDKYFMDSYGILAEVIK